MNNFQLSTFNFQLPLTESDIRSLSAGDRVTITGVIYTARDAAHKRMVEMLDAGEPLPIDLCGQAVYYAGPCPAPPGKIIGSIGPTTSRRMDAYTPRLIKEGFRVMIGKGTRGTAVVEAIREHIGLYLSAVGGAGAFYAKCVTQAQVVAFEDLGAEAIYKLTVRDMPLTVAIDCRGESIFELPRGRGHK